MYYILLKPGTEHEMTIFHREPVIVLVVSMFLLVADD